MSLVRKPLLFVLALALCCGVFSVPASRADDMPAGVKGDMMIWYKDAEQKLTDLSDAMPEGKYSWRPGKGVRSVGEVYMHVVAANYAIPALCGVQPPTGFDPMAYMKDQSAFEKSMTKKADIRKALSDSFAHLEKAFMETSDADMDKQVDLMGNKMSERAVYLLLLSHAHEHLGQSIAYARSNGVVPPWTTKQNAAMKEKMASEDKK